MTKQIVEGTRSLLPFEEVDGNSLARADIAKGIAVAFEPQVLPIVAGATWNYEEDDLADGKWKYSNSQIEIAQTPASPSTADTSEIANLAKGTNIELQKDGDTYIRAVVDGAITAVEGVAASENQPSDNPSYILGGSTNTTWTFENPPVEAHEAGDITLIQNGDILTISSEDGNGNSVDVSGLANGPIGTWIRVTNGTQWVIARLSGHYSTDTQFRVDNVSNSGDLPTKGFLSIPYIDNAYVEVFEVTPAVPASYQIPIKALTSLGTHVDGDAYQFLRVKQQAATSDYDVHARKTKDGAKIHGVFIAFDNAGSAIIGTRGIYMFQCVNSVDLSDAVGKQIVATSERGLVDVADTGGVGIVFATDPVRKQVWVDINT